MKAKNKILFIAATHGDEEIGLKALAQIRSPKLKSKFDFIIGNPKALAKKVRFVDYDLNRAAPGIKNSKKYELSRAWEIMKIAKNYKFVIDLHGTISSTGIFIIVTRPTLDNLLLAACLPIDNIVIWSDGKTKKFGPLSQFVDCGLEIESGPKISVKVINILAERLKSFLAGDMKFDPEKLKNKKIFRVTGPLQAGKLPASRIKTLKEFRPVKLGKEIFYPLMLNQYKGLICYKMEEISFWDLLAF